MEEGSTLYTTKAVVPRLDKSPPTQPAHPNLRLRPFRVDDLEVFHEIRNQEDVMKWTSKGVIDATIDETKSWMNRFLGPEDAFSLKDNSAQPQNGGVASGNVISTDPEQGPNYYSFVVEFVQDDGSTRIVGTTGCLNINVEPAIGYMFRKEEWGRGYATVTGKALLDNWYQLERKVVPVPANRVEKVKKILAMTGETIATGDRGSPLPEILHAVTEGTNSASGKVLSKLGFKLEREYTVTEHGKNVPLKEWFRIHHVESVI